MKPTPPPQFVNRPPDAWILVRVLSVIAGSPQTYTAEQWELGGGGTWAALTGGEQVTANNAGYTLPAADDSEITLAVDDFAWARLAPIAGGLFWELVPASSTYTPPDPDTGTAVSCGWLAGLLTTQCLTLTVLGATGLCSDIDDTQVLTLIYDTGTWTSVGTPVPDFTHDTGTGPAIFSVTADGLPKLTIDGVVGVLDGCGTSGGVHYADWAFGGTTLCDGTAEDCGGNIFRVRVTCTTGLTCEEAIPLAQSTAYTVPAGDTVWFTFIATSSPWAFDIQNLGVTCLTTIWKGGCASPTYITQVFGTGTGTFAATGAPERIHIEFINSSAVSLDFSHYP